MIRKPANLRQDENLYYDFSDPTLVYYLVEPRAFIYDVATSFIEKAKKIKKSEWITDENTTKGIILLLYAWNFPAPITKQLNFKKVGEMLKVAEKDLRLLEDKKITDDLDDQSWARIKIIFNVFREVCEQTGASKSLSLMNPHLFVMWDTEIRKRLKKKEFIPEIKEGRTGAEYVEYLKGVKRIIQEHQIVDKLPSGSIVAKKFDEYNFIRIVKKVEGALRH